MNVCRTLVLSVVSVALLGAQPDDRSPRGSIANEALAQSAASASPNVTHGRAVFDRVCGRCHPHGNADVGRRLIGIGWSEARVRTQVRRGRGTMRPISTNRMSDADLSDVIQYLRTLGTVR